MSLEAIRYTSKKDGGPKMEILDQLLLPNEMKYIDVKDCNDGWKIINRMQVRGAPAIAIAGCLSLAVDLQTISQKPGSLDELENHVCERLAYLVSARPTAVNIRTAELMLTDLIKRLRKEEGATVESVLNGIVSDIEKMLPQDVDMNKRMGVFGADHILKACGNEPVKILTHCNTGSLATGGYGTALGVVRTIHGRNRLLHCYCTETRPYNQGARLTAYELVHDKIPSTLICDNMVAMLMRDRGISAVVLGADRIVSNGDVANKIGTFQLAVLAKHFNIPFYVAAPSLTVDFHMKTGKEIVIEERPHKEMTTIKGIQLAPSGIGVWNPAFDVTPAELITGGIVTEYGVFRPSELEKLQAAMQEAENM